MGLESLRIAIVHEWLVEYAGSERVLEQILRLFPHADLYAIIDFLPDDVRSFIGHRKVRTSFIQRLPRARRYFRNYLPLMPLAVEQFDLSSYDLVISSNHAVAKGVITGPDQVHICYCHSPMRYVWDLSFQYLRESGLSSGLKSWIARYIIHRLRIWDQRTANGVDVFVANSHYIGRRIRKAYNRTATVIYPPVDLGALPTHEDRADFYVTVSRMVPYKRIDLIVEAFAHMPSKQLVVIGDGPEYRRIQRLATTNVRLLGYQATDIVRDYLQRARAFVFAAEEDFGIVTVEAQACGTPVIAYGKGGSLEIVVPGTTGVFFDRQNVESLVEAVMRFETDARQWSASTIRAQAERFSAERFRSNFSRLIEDAVQSSSCSHTGFATHRWTAKRVTEDVRDRTASHPEKTTPVQSPSNRVAQRIQKHTRYDRSADR